MREWPTVHSTQTRVRRNGTTRFKSSWQEYPNSMSQGCDVHEATRGGKPDKEKKKTHRLASFGGFRQPGRVISNGVAGGSKRAAHQRSIRNQVSKMNVHTERHGEERVTFNAAPECIQK